MLLFGDPPDASLPELANYRLKATRTRIPRLLAATNTQGSPRIIGGQIGSPVTLKATFDQDTALAPIGGAEYLAKLAAAGAPLTRVEVQDYARLVYDHWQRRQLIEFGEEVVGTAYRAELDNSASAQIERAESWLYRLAESGMPSFSAACNLAWPAKMPF